MKTSDWIGTAGVFLILLAYFCSTFKFISPQSRLYFALNTVGAGMACYASYLILYLPFVVLEGTWTLVSFAGLLKTKQA